MTSHFFKLGFTPCKDEQLLCVMDLQEKEEQDENNRRELFRKNPRKKYACRQRIPEPRRARKETVGIDILITSRNCDRKIMQPIRITSGFATRRRKWNQFIQSR